MTATEAHLSAYELDCLRLGRLPPEGARLAQGHLASCGSCRRLEEDLLTDQQHFMAEVLPRSGATLRARAEAEARTATRRFWLVTLVPLAPVLAVLALLVHPKGDGETRHLGRESYQGQKGGSPFWIVVRRGERVFRAAEAQPLRAGDAVRFVVVPPQAFVMIASVDGRGHSQVYAPYDGSESAAVPLDRKIELPENGSIELDATPGPERIFALFSRRPLPARAVLAALDRLGARGPSAVRSEERLEVGADTQLSELLEKER
jgi:hypothetical protein